MARFGVGDKVTVRSLKNLKKTLSEDYDGLHTSKGVYFIPSMEKYCGKTVTITEVHSCGYRIEEDGGRYNWTDEMFESHTIIIYTDGNKVIALDKNTGKTGVAYCSPEDSFDFFAGADLAYGRLRGRLKPAKDRTKKYYNGEIICTSTDAANLTKGKIYKVRNGQFRDDRGQVHGCVYPYVSFKDLNDQHFSEFIEVVR